MKVVHICTSLSGGAGLCAKRIINATRAYGIDARAIVVDGEKEEDWVSVLDVPYPWSKFWPIQKFQVLLNMYGLWPRFNRYNHEINTEFQRSGVKGVCVTSPVSRYNRLHEHPWIQEADIIHLQWVGNFLDYESFFKNVHKPIVWTIHDENPGLGGFHYTTWRDASSPSFKKLERKLVAIKREAYAHANNMTLVAISSMMKHFFQSNELLSQFPVNVIHNGIEIDKFQMLDKRICREKLDIPFNAIVFTFVAQDIHEGRKGLKELIAALELLNMQDVFLICLGGNNDSVPKASFAVRCVGFVSDPSVQSLYYSASDFFAMPSFQEAFAQTPMEAMACGTPVVAFPCSGAHDLINEKNGVVCSDFSVDALVDGIRQAMSQEYNPVVIREDVVARFSYDKIAKQYARLYEEVLCKS